MTTAVPALLLRDDIKARLLLVPELVALIGAAKPRIYDRVPTPTNASMFPFVAFGPMKFGRTEAGDAGPLVLTTHRLYTASTELQRDQSWQMAEMMRAALDGEQPDIGPDFGYVVEYRVIQGGDIIEPDKPQQVFLDVTCVVAQ